MSAATTSAEQKKALLAECRRRQREKADAARQAMEDAQTSANDASGAIEDKFESFREACQIQRDLFARQLDEALVGMATLNRLDTTPAVAHLTTIGLGVLVQTDRGGRFFLAISLGSVPDPVGGAPWLVVSVGSPIGQELVGKRVGETFAFRGETHRITSVA